MGTKIRDLTTTTSVATNDFLVVAKSDNTTKKISGANLTSSLVGGGGSINRYAVTPGLLSGITSSKGIATLGTGLIVPSGTSSVFILGAAMDRHDAFPSGASIPHNTGIKSWIHSAYRNLHATNSIYQARVYWGLHPDGAGQVDNKLYVVQTSGMNVTSLFLMFV